MSFGRRNGPQKVRGPESSETARPVRDLGDITAPQSVRSNPIFGDILIRVGQAACVVFIVGFIAFAVYGPPAGVANAVLGDAGAEPLDAGLPGVRAERSPDIEKVLLACLPSSGATRQALTTNESFWSRIDELGTQSSHGAAHHSPTVSHRTQGFARYLSCAMTTHRDRFCEQPYRADIALEIKYYFAALQRDFDAAMNARKVAATQEDFMDRIERLENDRTNPTSERAKADADDAKGNVPDESVVKAIRELVASGQLSREDFGWSLAPEIGKNLKNVVSGLDVCATRS